VVSIVRLGDSACSRTHTSTSLPLLRATSATAIVDIVLAFFVTGGASDLPSKR